MVDPLMRALRFQIPLPLLITFQNKNLMSRINLRVAIALTILGLFFYFGINSVTSILCTG
jgi:hypothetical protein